MKTRTGRSPPAVGSRRRGGRDRSPGSGDGFTLVELLVVLLLFGLVSAAAVPALGAILDPGPAEPARELAAVYARARETASTRGVTVAVTVDPRSGVWRTFAGDGRGVAVDRGNLLSGRPGVRLATEDGGPVTARFDPRGRARVPIVAVHHRAGTREVEVDPWTSSVRIR